MGPIELALVISIIFGMACGYKLITLRLALLRREEMIPSVRAIMNDPNASEELKHVSLAMLHCSTHSADLLRGFGYAILRIFRSQKAEINFSDDERKRYHKLLEKHFIPTNAIAGLHWYLLMFFIVFVVLFALSPVIFAHRSRARLRDIVDQFYVVPLNKHC